MAFIGAVVKQGLSKLANKAKNGLKNKLANKLARPQNEQAPKK